MIALLSTMVLLATSIFLGSTDGADVDSGWMKTILLSQFSNTRHHVTNPQNKEAARKFIEKEFISYGLQTIVYQFDTELPNVKGKNVIGVLKGKKFGKGDDLPIGVGAHFDTVRSTPGVDDNGSGVVALLQAAKSMTSQNCKPENTVFFVAFDFLEWEENVGNIACGHISCGSRSLVNDWIPQFWLDNYGLSLVLQGLPVFNGAIILDTIMNVDMEDYSQSIPADIEQEYPDVIKSIKNRNGKGDFIVAAGRLGKPGEQTMLNKFQNYWNGLSNPMYQVEAFDLKVIPGDQNEQNYQRYYGDFARSDQLQFWLKGYPAILITDTANLRGTCHHQACDSTSRVTDEQMAFLTKTTQTVIKTLSDLAGLSCPSSGGGTQARNVLDLLSSVLVVVTMSLYL